MAEFKLGRLRFVWKNHWASETVYYQDDVIAYGGKIYICVIGHTSSDDFFNEFNITPPKWNLVSDGQSWKGDWQPQTKYVFDDIVKYGGRLYICQTIHTSAEDSTTGLEADIAKWELFADGIEWKGEWQTAFDYKVNDTVKYGGSTYVCNNAHISAATAALGLEDDQTKWDLFNQGFDYKGTWSSLTRYKINDVVRFGANTYIATTYHTSASEFSTDSAYWTKFVDGFQYEDEWTYFRNYQIGDIVKYGGNQYIALTENENKIPPAQTADWSLFSEGFRYRGDWGDDSSNIDYLIGDLVRLGSYTYRCIVDHNNQQPPNATYWERFNTGIQWRGEWLDDQEYYEGDVVRYGDNSYVCINRHISEGDDYSTETLVQPGGGAENSRPDQDVTGTYWNIIAIGSETSVLTTTGDMVYYGGAGPTRLPIGKDGQVLKVSPSGVPNWEFNEYVDDVYYVAEGGVDSPAPIYGKSWDRPFKTIRYATEQVDQGARNPAATKLLRLNRRFIQREVTEWIDYQITNGISPFTTDFTYDATLCERDTGFIVDALIWDISHGGNVRSREAALSYFRDSANKTLTQQAAEDVAGYNYMLSVIESVLDQEAPGVNYQATNGDNSTAVVDQYFDGTLVAESVLTEITGLVGIITDAITAGVTDDIPERLVRTALIRVATGYYKEVLPIIVPAECCIMGDELRATNVQPRTKYNSADELIPSGDFIYTYEGIKHLETILPNIVSGTAITASTGNTETQDQTWPYAETEPVKDAVAQLARNIRRRIDIGLGNKVEAKLKPAYDLTDPFFGHQRDLNLANKKFIQEEVVGFITEEYPNLKYSRTKCKQDVGFILDAIGYDLTYGGNWQTVNAGEAYWSGTNQGDFVVNSSEKTATLAAYNYLKDLVQTVGRNITVTPTYQDDVEQISGVSGNSTAANFARDRMQEIINIITNGTGTVSITYPSLTGVSEQKQKAWEDAKNGLAEIQETTIDFINENFGPDLKYKTAKCRRDINLMINDLSYDVALGTNYNAVFVGNSYQRPINAYNLENEKVATVGSIRYVRDQLKTSVTTDGSSAVGSSNAKDRIQTAFNEVVDIINNNTPDTLSFPEPTGVTQDRADAKDNLVANRAFIVAEIDAWIADQVIANSSNPASIWYQFTYDNAKCQRDVGFIVDAMTYDILYGGTMATTRIAQSYFTGDKAYPDSEAAQTAAAYARLATVLSQVVQETSVTVSSGNAVSQTTLGTPATATEANEIDGNMQIIEDVITAGNLSGLPAISYPDITWADAEYQTAVSDMNSDKNDIIKLAVQYITNNYTGFVYDHDLCSRDLGIILDCAAYDWMLGSNFASIVAGYSYLREPSKKVRGDQKTATIAANEYARAKLAARINSELTDVGEYWYDFEYDVAKCERDVEYLVDAVRYDVTFNSNYRSVSSALRYFNGNAGEVTANQLQNTIETYEKAKELTAAELSDSTAIARSNALWTEILDILENGASAADAYTYPTPTGGSNNASDSGYANARDQIVANKAFIQAEIVAWIADQVAGSIAPFTSTFTYDSTACNRDVGLIIDALVYDLNYGGNLQTYDAALAYYVGAVAQYGTGEKAETLAALARLKTVVGEVILETTVTTSSGNAVSQDTSGTAGSVAAQTAAEARVQEIYDYLDGNGASAPTRTAPDITWTSATLQTEFAALGTAAQDAISSATTLWINDNIIIAGLNNTWQWVEDAIFSGAAEGGNNAVADIEVWNAIRMLELNEDFIVEEVLSHVDSHFKDRVSGISVANNTFSIADTSWLEINMPVKFYNDEDADDSTNAVSNAGLAEELTYYVREITSDTSFTISESLYGGERILADYGEGFVVEKAYEYNRTLCARDIREYLKGMRWDLEWPQEWKRKYDRTIVNLDSNGTTTFSTERTTLYKPGMYKTRLGARYYVNAAIGSQEEDFYYMRNGTGLRLQTLDGLHGDLGPANAFGTSRPTAGAYASLDPGWGPNDERVWIGSRSPYMQNCTCFGEAAIGQKVDGDLHAGGNDSMVSNDFTQLISDGIGAWITNNGRAELVSVFTYYSHVGYLAENGGRIRGTNGNNSYGTFGSVAEGVDPDEVPVTAIVDNRLQYNAVVSEAFTDGADEILVLEYSHAGNDYTEAKINIFGAGDNEVLTQTDFRDEAVNQVRIIEVDDSTGNPDATAGGDGYLVVTNTAQTGTTSSITLAATDGNSSTAYIGMKLYITSGQGVGQYGVVDTYNAGSKIATIVKDSDGTAGWDHVVPGTAIVAAASSSTYLIEPRAAFTAPTKTNSQQTITSGTYNAVDYIETSEQYTGVSTTSNSDGSGATFDVTRNGEKYYLTLNSAGTGYTRLDEVTILGTNVGGATTTHDITITITAVNSDGEVLAYDFSGRGRKGRFIALPNSGTAATYSIDGATWAASTLSTSATWRNLAVGKVDDGTTTYTPSYTVAVGVSGGNTIANYTENAGVSWTASSPTGLGATTNVDVAFGQIDTAISRFVIVGDNDQDVAYSDNGGATWTVTSTALPSVGYVSVSYGNGVFVAVKNGSTECAYSEDGITWSAGTMPSADGWNDVEFGNGRFVAITDDTTGVAYSFDGVTWTAVASALVGTAGNRIKYGQGMFVVTTDDTNQVSYSEYGVYWPSGGYTLSNTYTGGLNAIGFGNPDRDPKFVAIQSGSTTNVLNAKIGATAKGRAGVASEKVFEVRMVDPGSGYGSTAPTLTITDPNNIYDVLYTVRLNDGVLAQPTWTARGSGFITATAEIDSTGSNGNADFFQDGQYIAVRRLSATPVNGSNVVFDSLPDQVFKLVNTVSLVGTIDGDKVGFLQVSPPMEIEDTPPDQDPVTMRIRFSQVRLTGHDFLDIGTGGFVTSNYPNAPLVDPDPDKETQNGGGGRVFFTSTDQDGNFKVGDLFSIEQATGVATLNAEAFNIAGLQELTLGEVTLGGNSASVTEFSTDPFFTANSDSVVPTQRAIKAYIEAQIGGGGASLIVNSVTAGDVFINGTQITTVSGAAINIKANVNFQGAVVGLPLAYNYFFR